MSADRSEDRGVEQSLQLDGYLPYRLSVASNAVSGLIARAYEDRFALSIPQWRLICVLAEDGGLTQVQIVARTVMDKVTVGRPGAGQAPADRPVGEQVGGATRTANAGRSQPPGWLGRAVAGLYRTWCCSGGCWAGCRASSSGSPPADLG
jgi:hypothetical protein